MVNVNGVNVAEPNDPATCISDDELQEDKYVGYLENQGLVFVGDTNANTLFLTGEDGMIGILDSIPNKILCTDTDGNLTWRDRN